MQFETNLREQIRNALYEILESGAIGVALIGPEGFLVESVGDLSSREEGLSSVFVIAMERSVDYINEKAVKTISFLLGEKAYVENMHVGEFSYVLGDRKFLGLFVEGFLLVAGLKSEDNFNNVHSALINVISKISNVFANLSGKKTLLQLVAPPTKPPSEIQREIQEVKKPVKMIDAKKLEKLRFFVLNVREMVFDIKKNLIEHGDWYTALQDFKKFKERLDELKDLDEDLAAHPAIKAIESWVDKTISRIQLILDAKGNEVIDEERKNILRRGLSKAIEYIRFVISKELETK
jgi:hypothetical protein